MPQGPIIVGKVKHEGTPFHYVVVVLPPDDPDAEWGAPPYVEIALTVNDGRSFSPIAKLEAQIADQLAPLLKQAAAYTAETWPVWARKIISRSKI